MLLRKGVVPMGKKGKVGRNTVVFRETGRNSRCGGLVTKFACLEIHPGVFRSKGASCLQRL